MRHRLATVKRRLTPSLWIFASFLLPICVTYLAIQNHLFPRSTSYIGSSQTRNSPCQTLIADPNPPTNIRSSPIKASDNTIGHLPNGTTVDIIDENEGWLRMNAPVQGWIYKELTVTTCINLAHTSTENSKLVNLSSPEQGFRLLEIATDQYQAGNLNGAIALAKTVSVNSPVYQTANQAVMQWQRDWERAESEYYSSQRALREGQWEDVINKVDGYPDIRYWKEKLAIVVHQAAQKKRNPTLTAK